MNGYKDVKIEGEFDKVDLNADETKDYRALAARVNYIAQDNPCVQFAAKEICRSMAKPLLEDFQKVKKLARFMIGMKVVQFDYACQDEDEAIKLEIFVDSDWAGCMRTRRSTSSGLIKLGKHTLKTWSVTQAIVAMSSAEAELYAMTEGATRGIGLKTMIGELGVIVQFVELYTDSAAAKSFASRRGTGRMRHIEVKELWLQEAVKAGSVKLRKVIGFDNPADMLTKYLNFGTLCRLCKSVTINIIMGWYGTSR